MPNIELDYPEIALIYNDQIDYLRSVHHGPNECPSVAVCPRDHFDEDAENVHMRQRLMDKLSVA